MESMPSSSPEQAGIRRAALLFIESGCVLALLWLLYFGIHVALIAIQTLPSGNETGPLGDPYPNWAIWHFGSGLVFVVLAVLQLVAPLRRRVPRVHRISGWIAICAIWVAAVSAVALALNAAERPAYWRIWVAFQFFVVAAMVLRGASAARAHDFRLHQAWMVRSIATAAAVFTQRLVFPLFARIFGIHGDSQFWIEFTVAAVAATAINLTIAEVWLRARFARHASANSW